MPQTRFVLKKALALRKKVVVVINKIDRPGARPAEVVDEVIDLFIELGADEDQIEFPVVFASARDGYASYDSNDRSGDMTPIFESIVWELAALSAASSSPAPSMSSAAATARRKRSRSPNSTSSTVCGKSRSPRLQPVRSSAPPASPT